MGVFLVLQEFVVLKGYGGFFSLVVERIVPDHLDNVAHSRLVFPYELGILLLLPNDNADFVLLPSQLAFQVGYSRSWRSRSKPESGSMQ